MEYILYPPGQRFCDHKLCLRGAILLNDAADRFSQIRGQAHRPLVLKKPLGGFRIEYVTIRTNHRHRGIVKIVSETEVKFLHTEF